MACGRAEAARAGDYARRVSAPNRGPVAEEHLGTRYKFVCNARSRAQGAVVMPLRAVAGPDLARAEIGIDPGVLHWARSLSGARRPGAISPLSAPLSQPSSTR